MVTKDHEGGGGQDRAKGRVVPSLVSLTLAKVQRMLTSAVRSSSWPKCKPTLTNAIQSQVPHHLRQKLQNTVLHDWRLYDTISLRLLEVLLSSATSSLRLAHVRVFFRDAFLGLLHRLTGLQEFTLQDSAWTLSRQQMGVMVDAVSNMTNLRVLILHHCGHNLLLAAAASHCPHLQVVSVRGSRAVDDSGVWSLLTTPPRRPAHPHHSHKKTSVLTSWYSVIKSLTSITAAFNLLFTQSDKVPIEELPRSLSSEALNSKTAFEMSPCCTTLTFVDVRCTSVTTAGVCILRQALHPRAHIAHEAYQKL
ncbi:uncharacterized protein LOC126985316 [Eriocheir sinensis]|uniref:uncharacterized protein LOC126985316 n=1 Tax=Eriocheir sinensis TaxID=95602 RepID=UPI0021C828FD|nr:uncharacterized protein LOC126985316 [Eriocheir sinensis]XP_050696095.1 uncharacterized protein LOC126985316 [Eriocheir sinensis]XP_050696168.1 uncharacterized protein LOC126985316 [Eriocheir sinensis]